MRYAQRNAREIERLHPAMAHKVWQLISRLELIGEDILIVDGERTTAEQNLLWERGRTKPGSIVTYAYGDSSYHTWGLAIDFAPVGPLGIPLSKRYLLEWTAYERYDTVGAIATDIGLTWLYAETGFDRPHLQYTQGLSISDLRNGKTLSVEQAKQERVADIQKRLDMAKSALEAPYVSPGRKEELRLWIGKTEREIDRLNSA